MAKLWKNLGHQDDIDFVAWPLADESKISHKSIDFPIQINGKMRGTLSTPLDISKDELMALVLSDERFTKHLI